MTPPPDAQAILDFWFGASGSAEHGQQRKLWFIKSSSTDEQLRDRFGGLVQRALDGDLTGWDSTPRGTLARILLLDQFTRNIHRDTPAAFAGDVAALEAAKQLVETGRDVELLPVERIFIYLPFEHAENIGEQRMALRLFRALAAEHDGFESTLDYAERHHAVIERFGRFPHRNDILGRHSTPDELAYLAEPGSGF